MLAPCQPPPPAVPAGSWSPAGGTRPAGGLQPRRQGDRHRRDDERVDQHDWPTRTADGVPAHRPAGWQRDRGGVPAGPVDQGREHPTGPAPGRPGRGRRGGRGPVRNASARRRPRGPRHDAAVLPGRRLRGNLALGPEGGVVGPLPGWAASHRGRRGRRDRHQRGRAAGQGRHDPRDGRLARQSRPECRRGRPGGLLGAAERLDRFPDTRTANNPRAHRECVDETGVVEVRA